MIGHQDEPDVTIILPFIGSCGDLIRSTQGDSEDAAMLPRWC